MAKREMLQDHEAECVVGGRIRPGFIFSRSDITLGRGIAGSVLDQGVSGGAMPESLRSQGFLGMTREGRLTFLEGLERGIEK